MTRVRAWTVSATYFRSQVVEPGTRLASDRSILSRQRQKKKKGGGGADKEWGRREKEKELLFWDIFYFQSV